MATPLSSPAPSRPLVHPLEAASMLTCCALLPLLPHPWTRRLGAWLGGLGYRLDGRHRRVTLDNLALALPDLPEDERRRLARRCFRHLGSALVETLSCERFDARELLARTSIEGWEELERAEAGGRGVLLMTAHLGYWEVAGQVLAARGRPFGFLARPLDNPWLERRVRRLRERFGNRSWPKRQGVRRILRALGQGGRVSLLIDQRVHPNEGKAYPFFDRPAYTTPLLARLSLRTGAPVVPFFGLPGEEPGSYRVLLRPAIRPGSPESGGADPVDALTVRYLELVEEEIRRRPELWLWLHRRWRKNPTRFPKRRIPRNAAGPDGEPVRIEPEGRS